MDIQAWLDRSLRYLFLSSRQAELRRELQDHYEDHLEALVARGIPASEAEARAVEAMGDPEETGKLLRQLYRPWLSLALNATRLALGILLFLAIFQGTLFSNGLDQQLALVRSKAYYGREAVSGEGVLLAAREGVGDTVCKAGTFRVSVWAAWSRVWGSGLAETGQPTWEEGESFLVLRFQGPPWRRPNADVLERDLVVTDDQGRQYRSLRLYNGTPGDRMSVSDNFTLQYLGRDLSASYYLVQFLRLGDPESLELRGASEEFRLRVDFRPRKLLSESLLWPEEAETAQLETLSQLRPWLEEKEWRAVSTRTLQAAPVRTETLEASCPWARDNVIEYPPQQELARTLDCILELRGPLEELPISSRELCSRLRITDSLGRTYPLRDPEEWEALYTPELVPRIFRDRGYYRLGFETDGKADWYELTYLGLGGPLTLRIVPEEEERP